MMRAGVVIVGLAVVASTGCATVTPRATWTGRWSNASNTGPIELTEIQDGHCLLRIDVPREFAEPYHNRDLTATCSFSRVDGHVTGLVTYGSLTVSLEGDDHVLSGRILGGQRASAVTLTRQQEPRSPPSGTARP